MVNNHFPHENSWFGGIRHFQTINVDLYLKTAALFSAILILLKLSLSRLSFWGSQRSRISPLQSCMSKIRCGSKMMPGKSQDWLTFESVGQSQKIRHFWVGTWRLRNRSYNILYTTDQQKCQEHVKSWFWGRAVEPTADGSSSWAPRTCGAWSSAFVRTRLATTAPILHARPTLLAEKVKQINGMTKWMQYGSAITCYNMLLLVDFDEFDGASWGHRAWLSFTLFGRMRKTYQASHGFSCLWTSSWVAFATETLMCHPRWGSALGYLCSRLSSDRLCHLEDTGDSTLLQCTLYRPGFLSSGICATSWPRTDWCRNLICP